ncbi:Solanesyl-diphosphate synthase 1, mitochondrial [Glycine max]|nr:Solanesyl-diphosphate synthase 1, mitochondrial [Glycine max]
MLSKVASLIHDDVLDDADTRRGIGLLNFLMDDMLAVLARDFLLSRVVSLIAKVVEHLVTGETIMEYYMQKTYYKTAPLMSNSCKAMPILAGPTTDGLAFQLIGDVLDFTGTSSSLGKAPILFAMEEFPQLCAIVDEGFENLVNVDIVS